MAIEITIQITDQQLQELKEGIIQELTKPLMDSVKAKKMEWVNMKQLEEETGWGRTKLTQWREQGKFRFTRSSENGKVLYDLGDVHRFLRVNGLTK